MPPKRKAKTGGKASAKRQRWNDNDDSDSDFTPGGRPRCRFMGVQRAKGRPPGQCRTPATQGNYCYRPTHRARPVQEEENRRAKKGVKKGGDDEDDDEEDDEGEAGDEGDGDGDGDGESDGDADGNANPEHANQQVGPDDDVDVDELPKTPERGNAGDDAALEGEVDESESDLLARASGLAFGRISLETGRADELRVRLDVYSDPRWTTRIFYFAEIELLGNEDTPPRNIGSIQASRVSKPTAQQPHISDQWKADWLQARHIGPPEDERWWVSLAHSLQAVYDRQGNPRQEVAQACKAELEDNGNDLLYISHFQLLTEVSGPLIPSSSVKWQPEQLCHYLRPYQQRLIY